MVNILQIYNWFPHRQICTAMSLFLSAEFFGYYLQLWFLDSNFYQRPAYWYIFGALFLALATLDRFIYAYCPSSKDIYIDQRQSFLMEAPEVI